MHIPDAAINRLAEQVVRAIVGPGFVTANVSERDVVAQVSRLLLDNLRAEQALEEEAERMAIKLGRQALGMDQRKLSEGIKARLARERGFIL
ncbi:MAG: DUF507 family protein [Candidatus Binatia bacterium]